MARLGAEALHYIGAAHCAVGIGDDIGRLVIHQTIRAVDGDTVNAGYVELDRVADAICGVHVDAELGAGRCADAELIVGSVVAFASIVGNADVVSCTIDEAG